MPEVCVPTPYDDEPLYGILSRCLAHGAALRPMILSRALFGTAQVPSIDLPQGLDRFAEATSPYLGLDGEGCARKLTLAPFYLAHLPEHRRVVCLAALRGRMRGNPHALLGVASSRVATPVCLRLCEACRREQRRTLGEAHWRRVHQLPGVLLCPDHGIPLLWTPVPYRTGDRDYRDADRIQTLQGKLPEGCDPGVVGDLASACVAILGSDVSGAPPMDRRLVTAATSRRSGLELSRAFVDRIGPELLDALGCGIDPSDYGNWFLMMHRTSQRRLHPVQHALVSVFIHRLELSAGWLGVPMGRPPVARSDAHAKSAELKTRWRLLLRRVPGRSRAAAAAMDPDLWAALEEVAPGWASGEGRGYNRSPENQRRVHVATRDAEWLERLDAATGRVRMAVPPRRVTRSAIIREAGLPRGASAWMGRLPNCAARLASEHEALGAFHARKVAHVAEECRQAGGPLSIGRLRRVAKLTGPIDEVARKALLDTVIEACR